MILFVGSSYIKTDETPKFNDYHKAYYVHGFRWIKSKKKFSSSNLLHNFPHYEKLDENQEKCFEQSLNV